MLMGEQRRDPFGRPGAFVAAIDMAQRLERDSARLAIMVATKAERMVCATHSQPRGTRRKSLVTYIDLRTIVAPDLKSETREQHSFAGAGWSDKQHSTEERSVGKERVTTCRPQCSPYLIQTTNNKKHY